MYPADPIQSSTATPQTATIPLENSEKPIWEGEISSTREFLFFTEPLIEGKKQDGFAALGVEPE